MTPEYQVSLFVSRCNLPIFFAVHPWFVVRENGQVTRYEVRFIKDKANQGSPYIHVNFLGPYTGLGVLPPMFSGPRWKAKLVGNVSGPEASKVIEIIISSHNTYPFIAQSGLFGPNSNTYAQWILNQCPEFKVKLPRNAFGKNYNTQK